MTVAVEKLSKKYMISHRREDRLSLSLANAMKRLKLRLFSPEHGAGNHIEEFVALHELSFEVKRGERIGLLGANGAGKSTLLKILSRITPPTSGSVKIEGRVGSLLEVGAGFHPDLTGRENIFLNGAILGLTKREIEDKFSVIVEFAEIQSFLDVPIKRYSSGMRAKLGFSIAIHVNPDILIVDEALAVGDVSFQKKCLKKMESFADEGKTLFFVGHQMEPLLDLCTRGIYLKQGRLVSEGPIETTVARYLEEK